MAIETTTGVTLSDGYPRPARAGAEVRGEHYRFTVLTSRLIRMEWSRSGRFVDEATTVVTSRDLEVPDYAVEHDGEKVTIRTEHLRLTFDGQEFSSSGLSVTLAAAPDIHYSTWRFGHEPPQHLPGRGNLGGTARTLDDVDGACPLEPGILSTYGFATLDDSASPLMSPDGWVTPRPDDGIDLYLFGHGRDYQAALDDYFRITGAPALLPRYVLGNWWSRYWRYEQSEYLQLMDDFAAHRLPFSVSVIDMDWHEVDIDPALGTGWTGYTWNRTLFPDPAGFLEGLHHRGLAVTLNVHPADGVRRHEAAYPAVARSLGLDPDDGAAIPFDITSRRFVDSYLGDVHHPLEDDGVDFWWLDWQSGHLTNVPGLDPLWMLNHLHFLDSAREGRRPLTFSRYSGPGSQRYPIGFSGDTIASWASLAFQPEFTATAANIGYGWWSHDIGGHMHGSTDPELTARWIQLGALSPVNRLHSSASAFSSKDPRTLGPEAAPVAESFLRLRHVLVPYLYSAAWRAHTAGVAIARPLYHRYPHVSAAYRYRHSYLFGEDLLVVPITSPRDPRSRLAASTAWVPEGTWTDVLTGAEYEGGRTITFHRSLAQYPVLARAGSVLPLAADAMAPVAGNPDDLVLRIQPGSGTSELYEDDGTASPRPWLTRIEQSCTRREDGALDLTVELRTSGPCTARELRSLTFDLVGIDGVETAVLRVDGLALPLDVVDTQDDATELLAPALRLRTDGVDLHATMQLEVVGARRRRTDSVARIVALLHQAHIEVDLKDAAYAAALRLDPLDLIEELVSIGLPESLQHAIVEVLSSAGGEPS